MHVYEAIYRRRDVREFRDGEVPDQVLERILDAAHHAGSVGLMQPWNFIVIRSADTRWRIAANQDQEDRRASANYGGVRRKLYESLRRNSIEESSVNVAVTCDRDRKGPHVLGRNTMRDTDIYSTCCAIQNMWLTALAEGLGMCWVSSLDPEEIKSILKIPKTVELIAYLCFGYPAHALDRPLLETAGWESRQPLQAVVFGEQWQQAWEHLGDHQTPLNCELP